MDQNEKIKKHIEEGRNIYITGEAGTGKSYLLNSIASDLATEDKAFAILAPTGLAAINVKGQTIHKFCGFAPKPGYQILENPDQLRRTRKAKLLQKLDIIILDEVSMIRADLLDAMDMFFRINRNNEREPFGGIQVIMFGDHFQLPPIVKSFEKEYFTQFYESPYFFHSKVYEELAMLNIKLLKNYRQSDLEFIKILQLIRHGKLQPVELEYINEKLQISSTPKEHSITVASRNQQVDQKNQYHLDSIESKEYVFRARQEGNFDEKSSPAEPKLHLKVGAQIIFIKNDPENRWVNGTLGEVLQVKSAKIIVQLQDGKKVEVEPATWEKIEYQFNVEKGAIEETVTGSLIQFPIKLAWAVSIHKSQGQTYESCLVDLGYSAFAPGQTYVALSRAKTIEGLYLKRALRNNDIITDPKITEFEENTEWNVEL